MPSLMESLANDVKRQARLFSLWFMALKPDQNKQSKGVPYV